MAPITPITSLGIGPEFSIGPLEETAGQAAGAGSAAGAGGFGQMLVGKVAELNGLQANAASQSEALAAGKATDAASVVMQVEQAALALQLAVQVRNKGVEAYQEIMHMQV
jgi:flagellar hook-basal body complex protein FliE